MDEMIEKVKAVLGSDDSGHNMDHVMRVLHLSQKFAKEENANIEIASYIALLHDVDDYKLFGIEDAEKLSNARTILKECQIPDEIQETICSELSRLGYSKSLVGIRPQTLEGKIVSDADMCDALGITGVIRTHQYSLKHGNPFFDKSIFPQEKQTSEKYMNRNADTAVCHFFEKLLKLKNIMLTNAGRKEAQRRHDFLVELLHHLFEEEDAPEWEQYLTRFLANEKKKLSDEMEV